VGAGGADNLERGRRLAFMLSLSGLISGSKFFSDIASVLCLRTTEAVRGFETFMPTIPALNSSVLGLPTGEGDIGGFRREAALECGLVEMNLLPEIKPLNESMNARRRPLSRLSAPPAPTIRRNSAPEPAVSLSVLPVSLSDTPGMIDLGKSRPASSLAMRKR
jgi:hypothetical protein